MSPIICSAVLSVRPRSSSEKVSPAPNKAPSTPPAAAIPGAARSILEPPTAPSTPKSLATPFSAAAADRAANPAGVWAIAFLAAPLIPAPATAVVPPVKTAGSSIPPISPTPLSTELYSSMFSSSSFEYAPIFSRATSDRPNVKPRPAASKRASTFLPSYSAFSTRS